MAGLPDPDLLIRTSGEMRLSNFLLWQLAYTELWITETLWPDFRRRHLYQAIADVPGRSRRLGRLECARPPTPHRTASPAPRPPRRPSAPRSASDSGSPAACC